MKKGNSEARDISPHPYAIAAAAPQRLSLHTKTVTGREDGPPLAKTKTLPDASRTTKNST